MNKSPWTEEDDQIIAMAHMKYGNQWSNIAKLLPGRSVSHEVRGGGDNSGTLPSCIMDSELHEYTENMMFANMMFAI